MGPLYGFLSPVDTKAQEWVNTGERQQDQFTLI